VDIHESGAYKPAASADFDGADGTGKISDWVTGEFDFEAICTADGRERRFFQHEEVERMDDPSLNMALASFVAFLASPRAQT
jgi:hypothetical protein